MRRLIALLLFVLLLGAGAAGALWYALREWQAPGPLAEPAQVVVPRGGTAAIADALAERGIIDQPMAFLAATWLTRGEGPIRAAEFQFPARASLRQVLEVLREGRPVQRRLTIPEGLTARQIATLLEQAEGLVGEIPPVAEGEILPETYAYQWGDSRAAVVRRAKQAMDRALAEIWAERAQNLPMETAREALILASIVERETGRGDERAQVAGVFVNRLRRGMMLQSDPTTAYAAADGGVLDRPLTRADLERDHPFNTYRIRGLPPAPIASPGRDSLRAVARPAAHDYLYFVADGTGGHDFSRTLEEHNRAVARWRQIERSRAPAPTR
ncbi:endolytic transglycosylase MltG [Falsiroseomonas sp. E2-1-a20]|uniref:endolytic transglycosylase MltG n=1 Tax=Falsiroseomonas sp. E2-1-a20 TaxID=3239300 RepID=UPI003F3B2492